MKRIIVAFWLVFGVVNLAWIAVEPAAFTTTAFIPLRNLMMQWSGLLAMVAMSVAMILALRPIWLEPHLGGLDKMYRLHKWLGIGALVLGIAHWLSSKAPGWAVALSLMERGQRPPRLAVANAVAQFLSSYRGSAELVGEWTFYAAVLLIVVALVKLIPYRVFHKTHRWLALAYLALVFHSVVLLKFGYWLSPVGVLLIPLLLAGCYSAVIALLQRIAIDRRATGRIRALEFYPGVRALEVVVDSIQGWKGHAPGQFAFATSNSAEGAHPYTIASAWHASDPRITFIVKELGDHTGRLRDTLGVDRDVMLEGPYGCFTFQDQSPVQIWIGAGIGITPFIARMKDLTDRGGAARRAIHLFHPTATSDAAALAKLETDAKAAGVDLHISIDTRDGLLSGERIRATVPRWREASLWFCGPTSLASALRRDFTKARWPAENGFNQELFDMR